jgi:tricarboxylate carrier
MNVRVLTGASFGLASGLAVVSITAKVASSSQPPPPTFNIKTSRFNTSTFSGRFSQMLNNMDPSTLLASDTKIREAEGILNSFVATNGLVRPKTDDELWAAKKLVDSAVHPDTKEIIPKPFRMSGYVPFNGPVCVAMMVSSTTPTLLFWNWVNQSQNALVNYFNRNASSPTSNEILAKSYATAVGCALFVAFGVSQFIQRRYNPAQAQKLLKFVALPSSMVASSANAFIMRSPEIDSGITILDAPQGEKVAGGCKNAAKRAVQETAFSRVLLQLPTFFVPPLFMMLPPIASAAAASPVIGLTANTFITLVGFGLGLPAAVAYFPQIGEIKVEDIEEGPAKEAAMKKGLKSVYYNKGL